MASVEQTAIKDFVYDAFISYRHGGDDAAIAERLHGLLEGFRTPAALVQRGVPRRLKRVFRDREELPTSSDLSESILKALTQSRFLIVVCSPRSRESKWVAKEIEVFRALGRGANILTLLIDGEPAEAFPPSLVERRIARIVDDSGAEKEVEQITEPLAADIRTPSLSARLDLLKAEVLRILAPLLGCTFDDLRQRHQARMRRRLVATIAVLSVASLLFAGLSVLASVMYSRAEEQRKIALAERDKALLTVAQIA